MLNEAVPFFPNLKVSPGVAPRVNVPFVTARVSASAPAPALASATDIALPLAAEKLSDKFSPSEPAVGAVMVGGLRASIATATLVAADWPFPGSVTEIANESAPQ